MKYLLKISIILMLSLWLLSFWYNTTFANVQVTVKAWGTSWAWAGTTSSTPNLKTWTQTEWTNWTEKENSYLQKLLNQTNDYTVATWGQTWIKNLTIRVALDLKNIFFVIAWVYFLIIVIRLLFSNKTEEEITNFKKWVIWISVWIIITQIAYSFITVLYNEDINASLAQKFVSQVVNPLVLLLQTTTSFIFIAIMIYAFFRLVTANWDEEKAKNWKMSVVFAIVWFIVVKISAWLVSSTYAKINCSDVIWWTCNAVSNLEGFAKIVVSIINWMNTFVWLLVIIMIIYAWFLTFTSGWDEEKLKKTKNIIIYIVIWVAILIASYLILTFFIPNA